jgi:hypothetical protein
LNTNPEKKEEEKSREVFSKTTIHIRSQKAYAELDGELKSLVPFWKSAPRRANRERTKIARIISSTRNGHPAATIEDPPAP